MDNNQYRNPNIDPAPSGDRGLNDKSIDVSINMPNSNKSQDYINRSAGNFNINLKFFIIQSNNFDLKYFQQFK